LAPVIGNVVMSGCALGLSPHVQTPLDGLAAGVVVGGVRRMASFSPGGSVSYLYDGNRLVQFPLGIFGAAIRQLKAR
jgi:peptidoglycan biosynthesis protein MviN/MurJ (putative lipid II flippase)